MKLKTKNKINREKNEWIEKSRNEILGELQKLNWEHYISLNWTYTRINVIGGSVDLEEDWPQIWLRAQNWGSSSTFLLRLRDINQSLENSLIDMVLNHEQLKEEIELYWWVRWKSGEVNSEDKTSW